jgi:serine protease AprX
LNKAGTASRVVVNQDFTGEGITSDPFGHGTFVAATAAGYDRAAPGTYNGIAPNANVLNLRVLNSKGTGTVSSVLSALNWITFYRSRYNIRVVNMSLGMPAIDSYKTILCARPCAAWSTPASSWLPPQATTAKALKANFTG